MTLVFMFPGQSSRYPGMVEKLVGLGCENRRQLEEASDLLEWDLGRQFRSDNPDVFARNVDVQVGVFLANHMFLRTLHAAGVDAEVSLGLSLGEYNHLVHIGALTFSDALLAVRARGEAYDAGPRGVMASVQPITFDELEPVVARARAEGIVEITNLNSPTQQVLSGEQSGIREALRILDDEFYVQSTVIEKRVPMHSSLFRNVGRAFRAYLATLPFASPRRPYLPNRLGRMLTSPDRDEFIELLSSHVYSRVHWRRSIETVVQHWADATFVEVGPLSVLHNLMSRKWVRNRRFRTDSSDALARHIDGVVSRLELLRNQPSSAREVGCSAT
ncbi:MAG: ACP S-malonyltransferase [Nannocystaceae bacterium]